MSVQITRNAGKRMKQRTGLPKKSQMANAERALAEGATHKDTAGSLHRYIDSLFFANPNVHDFRIFSQRVYLFAGSTLVTVLPLPRKYYAAAEKAKRNAEKRQGEEFAEEVRKGLRQAVSDIQAGTDIAADAGAQL